MATISRLTIAARVTVTCSIRLQLCQSRRMSFIVPLLARCVDSSFRAPKLGEVRARLCRCGEKEWLYRGRRSGGDARPGCGRGGRRLARRDDADEADILELVAGHERR